MIFVKKYLSASDGGAMTGLSRVLLGVGMVVTLSVALVSAPAAQLPNDSSITPAAVERSVVNTIETINGQEQPAIFYRNRCDGSEMAGIGVWLAIGFASLAAAWNLFLWLRTEATAAQEAEKKPDFSAKLRGTVVVIIVTFALFGVAATTTGSVKFFGQCHTITISEYDSYRLG